MIKPLILWTLFVVTMGCSEDTVDIQDMPLSKDLHIHDMEPTLNVADMREDMILPVEMSHFDMSSEGPPCHSGGGERIALYIRQLVPIDGVAPGENVMVENGFNYLIVNERCEFWNWNGTGDDRVWSSVTHGVLSSAQASQLEQDLDLKSWQSLDRQLFVEKDGGDPPTWDMNYRHMSWGARCIECNDKVLNAKKWIQNLNATTEELAPTGLRLIAQHISPEDLAVFNKPTTPAPTTLDLKSMAYPYTQPPHECGQGELIEEPSLMSELLEIRELYRSGQMGQFWYQFIPLQDQEGTIYKVHFRESTPFDNAQGLIEFGSHFGTCL